MAIKGTRALTGMLSREQKQDSLGRTAVLMQYQAEERRLKFLDWLENIQLPTLRAEELAAKRKKR